MFSHWDARTTSRHITLHTEAGAHVTATPGHYLWTAKHKTPHDLLLFESTASIKPLRDVRVGDVLWLLGSQGDLRPDRVVERSESWEEGLYNPHTRAGSIVVDGVAALTFTEVIPASLTWHTIATSPGRALFACTPSLRFATMVNKALLRAWPTHVLGRFVRAVACWGSGLHNSTAWL